MQRTSARRSRGAASQISTSERRPRLQTTVGPCRPPPSFPYHPSPRKGRAAAVPKSTPPLSRWISAEGSSATRSRTTAIRLRGGDCWEQAAIVSASAAAPARKARMARTLTQAVEGAEEDGCRGDLERYTSRRHRRRDHEDRKDRTSQACRE